MKIEDKGEKVEVTTGVRACVRACGESDGDGQTKGGNRRIHHQITTLAIKVRLKLVVR